MAEGSGRGKAARIAQEILRRALMPASYLIAGLGCGALAVVSAEGSWSDPGRQMSAFLVGAATLGRRG